MLAPEFLRYLEVNIGDYDMALVTQIGSSKKDRHSVHSPTTCLYSIFRGPQSRQYLQLDTYGSEGREFPEKVSQSLQFTEESAARLKELIVEAFPNLA